MTRRRLVLGTRGSPLALWQSRHVAGRLAERHDGLEVDLVVIKTEGDQKVDVPLGAVGGKGLFVREIEEALADGRIDLAVHSMKDLPTEQPDGLTIAAVPERYDPRDAVLSVAGHDVASLPDRTVVATGSPRRRCQLLRRRPDLEMTLVRGNVDTRIRKLVEGRFGAMVLAAAGVGRLGIDTVPVRPIDLSVCLPAVGQGALAIETRADDRETRALVAALDDADTARAVAAERAFLHRLGGGCLAPAAALAVVRKGRVRIEAMVGDPDGRRLLRDAADGDNGADAESLGEALAVRLLEAGGAGILADARAQGGGLG